MSDLRKAVWDYMSQFGQALEAHGIPYTEYQKQADEALRAALAETREPVTRIQELEQLVKAQQKAFDIESNRVTFANHKSLHKMLIRDAIKKMNDCKGRPYSAWDIWLIDATCMLERVLREWPEPQEVTLTAPPSIDALIGEIDGLEVQVFEISSPPWTEEAYHKDDIKPILDKYRAKDKP